jgi:hypothetical protein
MSNNTPIWRTIAKTCILWLIVSVGFGLLKLWIVVGDKWIQGLSDIDIRFVSGTLLFYCSGIVVSSAFDSWIEKGIDKSEFFNMLFHIIIPTFLLIGITVIFLRVTDDNFRIDRVKRIHWSVLIFSLSYSTFSKMQLGLIRNRREAEEG